MRAFASAMSAMAAAAGVWVCTSMLPTPPRCSIPVRKSLSASSQQQQQRLVVTGALSTGGEPSGGGGEEGLGSTRLGRLISVRRRELLARWNTVRRNFPAKIFLLLFGFFFANALATILGQTGDWDVIAAGILVAIIEGIGHLMYRLRLGARGKRVVELVNYWKIGFTFALFVDAFKVGS